jgi:hypothetical protein
VRRLVIATLVAALVILAGCGTSAAPQPTNDLAAAKRANILARTPDGPRLDALTKATSSPCHGLNVYLSTSHDETAFGDQAVALIAGELGCRQLPSGVWAGPMG